MEKVTVDTIIDFFQENIEERHIMHPDVWIDAAEKLNVLRGEEDDKLVELMMLVNQKKVQMVEEYPDYSMAKITMYVEASEEYRAYKQQQARCERIAEFIRLGKLHARLKNEEMMGK